MGGGGAEKEERGVGLGASEQAPFLPRRTKREAQWALAHLQLSEEMGFGGTASPPPLSSPPTVAPSAPAPSRFGLDSTLSSFLLLPVTSLSAHHHPQGLCLVFSFPLSSHPSPSSSIPPSSPTLSLLSVFPSLFPGPFPRSASMVRRPRSRAPLRRLSSLAGTRRARRRVTPKPCGDSVPGSGPPNPPRYTRGGEWPRKASDGPKALEHSPCRPTAPGAPTHCPD